VSTQRTAVLITHPKSPSGHRWADSVDGSDGVGPSTASEAVEVAVEVAREAGWRLVATPDEMAKHGDAAAGIERADTMPQQPDLCLVLGGDGSILYALRRFARTGVLVFGVNFGTVGFLAGVERDDAAEGIRRALAGETESIDLPGLEVAVDGESHVALNDVTFARRPQDRVAELSYKIAGEEVGHVRCDGLVAATPAGSTGYNLANQGPILAWGVEGYVVSYIAPHSLTARALVVAPSDILHVGNAAGREGVDVAVDGEHVGELAPGAELEVRFADGVGRLAQLPGSSFYQRIREKFGHLAV
jgi:NAD+ kinase